MKIELDDPKKASIFLIQFLGLRPSLVDFKTEKDTKLKSIYSDNFYIPNKLQFTLNFFDFPTFKSDVIVYENNDQMARKNI